MRLNILDLIRDKSSIPGRKWHHHPRPLGAALEWHEQQGPSARDAYLNPNIPLPAIKRCRAQWRRFGVTLQATGHAVRAGHWGGPEAIIAGQAESLASNVAELLDCYYPGDLYIGGEDTHELPRCDDSDAWWWSMAVAGKEHPSIDALTVIFNVTSPPWWERAANRMRRLFRRRERWGPKVYAVEREAA